MGFVFRGDIRIKIWTRGRISVGGRITVGVALGALGLARAAPWPQRPPALGLAARAAPGPSSIESCTCGRGSRASGGEGGF